MKFFDCQISLLSFLLILTSSIVFENSLAFGRNPIDTIQPLPIKPKTIFANVPPVLSATGNQIYCPGSSINIVTSMSITDPDDTGIQAMYIQISSGYVNGQDMLILTGTHPGITSSWDVAAGKMTLKSPTNAIVSYTDFINAIEDIVYSNSATFPSGTRTFSITVGEANYLPSTGHYYKFIPSLGITWTSARALAETDSYYGLQGYLATLTATDESQLCGEQASGAGWIGGSDAQQEGVWKWVTGPESGTIFWNGDVNGSSPNYAFWNTSEPNNLGNENYAHITAPGVGIPGSWNDLTEMGGSSGDYQPKGYIVEYGGMPGDAVLNISTSTTITIPKITSTTTSTQCGPGSVTLTATADSGMVKWYDSATATVPLATGSSFTTPNLTTSTTYYVDAFNTGCTTGTRTTVTATINEIPVLSVIQPGPACEGSINIQGTTTVGTIQWFTEATGGIMVGLGTDFDTPDLTEDTTFYAEAINNGCSSGARIPVTVTVYKRPEVQDEQLPICEDGTLPLDAGISDVTYLWSRNAETSRSIIVDAPGTYSVTVTNPQNCSSVKTFTITEKLKPVISNIVVEGNLVTIVMANTGNFQYSVDGVNFQDSNVFTVTKPGINTAYVTETNFCGNDKKDFIIIVIPTFFTPNNDSYNDIWTVEGMFYYPESTVGIYDRYGKLISELNQTNYTWNGTYNGLPLPSDDYWYVFKLDNTTPIQRGHFSMVR